MQMESCCPPRFAKIVLFGLMANYFLARGKETLARYWNNSQTQNINIDFISRYMVRCRSRDSQRIFFYQTGRSFLPKKYLISLEISYICSPKVKERCSSGLRGTPGKRVYPKRVSRVRIPISPQKHSLSRSQHRKSDAGFVLGARPLKACFHEACSPKTK